MGGFMQVSTKKSAIFDLLQKTQEPIGVSELLHKVEGAYSERSVSRWLSELVREGFVERIGKKRGAKYRALVPKEKKPLAKRFSAESQTILAQIKKPLYERPLKSYSDEWFEAYTPNVTYYLPKAIRDELYHAGKRAKNEEPAGTYAHQIFNRLLIDLSYNSSRLEGNTYSLLDTQKLLLEGKGAEDKLDEEKIMILNHKEAIRYLVDNAPRLQVDVQTICTVHYLLSEGLVESQYAGKVRDYGVRIGGSTYIPFEGKKQLQTRLERITEKARLIKDPYEQSLFLLVHLSYLQAFSDVNKRTARLSANISLIKNNLVPLSFNDIAREDYTSAVIAIYELQEVRPLVDLYAFSYMRTCSMYDETVKAMGFDEIRVRYREKRRALLREIIRGRFTGKKIQEYVQAEADAHIHEPDREAFVEDVFEDLREMDLSRLVGLGVTPEELSAWQKLQK